MQRCHCCHANLDVRDKPAADGERGRAGRHDRNSEGYVRDAAVVGVQKVFQISRLSCAQRK
jgi:hypothetical protein